MEQTWYYASYPLAAGRHGGRPRCARVGGPWVAPAGVLFPCTSADVRAVLSHSRERTKGRPVAANPGQHHGCPRTPRRVVWGQSLMGSEANCFLAGAAWSGLGCCARCTLAAGRHRWAALVARRVVGLAGFGGVCDLTGQTRYSISWWLHDRRSMSSLRRPPQEDAASHPYGGGRKPHAKRGDRRGAPPELAQPRILPRRGRCHGSCRDG